MSADLLRKAASQARAEADLNRAASPQLVAIYADDCGTELEAQRHLAVADWLTETADAWDMNGFIESDAALAVARAYLGSDS
jgi:hypothetical protein